MALASDALFDALAEYFLLTLDRARKAMDVDDG
jgi:hypothetical protein